MGKSERVCGRKMEKRFVFMCDSREISRNLCCTRKIGRNDAIRDEWRAATFGVLIFLLYYVFALAAARPYWQLDDDRICICAYVCVLICICPCACVA